MIQSGDKLTIITNEFVITCQVLNVRVRGQLPTLESPTTQAATADSVAPVPPELCVQVEGINEWPRN